MVSERQEHVRGREPQLLGEMAVEKGYCTPEQVAEALEEVSDYHDENK